MRYSLRPTSCISRQLGSRRLLSAMFCRIHALHSVIEPLLFLRLTVCHQGGLDTLLSGDFGDRDVPPTFIARYFGLDVDWRVDEGRSCLLFSALQRGAQLRAAVSRVGLDAQALRVLDEVDGDVGTVQPAAGRVAEAQFVAKGRRPSLHL